MTAPVGGLPRLFATETVVCYRRDTTVDEYHNVKPADWAVAGTYRASVTPMVGQEDLVDRDMSTELLTAYLPADADVTSLDEVAWRGNRYQVNGPPQRWSSPMRALGVLVVNLIRTIDEPLGIA